MSKLLYYYDSGFTLKRNVPLYLSKAGMDICHINSIYEVDKALDSFQPKALLVTNDSDAVLLSKTSTLPIIVILDSQFNTYENNQSFKDIKNPVFIRSCNDSLDTILNTAVLATTL